MKTILVVDDEPTLAATVRYNLEQGGYRVITAADGESGLSLARSERPDTIVLDLMLPGLDGLDVCRILRRESSVPILMLTARGEETDRVVGLELGADDYLTKPFSMRELLARVRALLRRSEMATQVDGEVVTCGDLEVDAARHQVRRSGAEVALKPKEFELLAFLMRNRRRVFTREQLLNQIWGYEFAGDTRTVDVHVSWLRQKVEDNPQHPALIVTVRGIGYRFDG
ncbi:MAG: response regulator transcription factor [Dehalococcoidia bacterium]|nr:response regulator transcription factor [Dehalococcoidia bacterium]